MQVCQTAHLGSQGDLHSVCQLVDAHQHRVAGLNAIAHVFGIVALLHL